MNDGIWVLSRGRVDQMIAERVVMPPVHWVCLKTGWSTQTLARCLLLCFGVIFAASELYTMHVDGSLLMVFVDAWWFAWILPTDWRRTRKLEALQDRLDNGDNALSLRDVNLLSPIIRFRKLLGVIVVVSYAFGTALTRAYLDNTWGLLHWPLYLSALYCSTMFKGGSGKTIRERVAARLQVRRLIPVPVPG